MSIGTFLRDRIGFIAIYFINVGLAVLIMGLSMLQQNMQVANGNILYIFILSCLLLVIYLTISYIRQRPLYQSYRLAISQHHPEHVWKVRHAKTYEQQAFMQLLHKRHQAYMKDIVRYEEQEEQHHHFMNQWVHQMKTPVSVIQLLTEEGRHLSSFDEVKPLMNSIEQENQQLSEGLNMVLHMARLQKFEIDVSFKRLSLTSIVRDTINQYKKKWIRFKIYPEILGDNHINIESDDKWLRFIIEQLTNNAIKYTSKYENKHIYYKVSVDHNDDVILQVCDEGIGIPKQDMKRIFDAFFTGDNGRKLSAESTGMGLYMVEQVCSRLGHDLTVQSTEGEGTTFTLRFTSESIHRDILAD